MTYYDSYKSFERNNAYIFRIEFTLLFSGILLYTVKTAVMCLFLSKVIMVYQAAGCLNVLNELAAAVGYVPLRYVTVLLAMRPFRLHIYLPINNSVMQHAVPVSLPVNTLIGRTETIKA